MPDHLTRVRFVNAWLVREEDDFTLVDTTTGSEADALIAAAERAGGSSPRIALTHGHSAVNDKKLRRATPATSAPTISGPPSTSTVISKDETAPPSELVVGCNRVRSWRSALMRWWPGPPPRCQGGGRRHTYLWKSGTSTFWNRLTFFCNAGTFCVQSP